MEVTATVAVPYGVPQVAHVSNNPSGCTCFFFSGRYSGLLKEKQFGHCAAFDANDSKVRMGLCSDMLPKMQRTRQMLLVLSTSFQ